MSVNVSVQIGPYIEAIGKAEVKIEKVKRICPNHPNSKVGEAKFCPTCGTLIKNKDYVETHKLSAIDVLNGETYHDELWASEGMENIIMSNETPPDDINFYVEYGNSVEITNPEDTKTKQLTWFNKAYQKEITMLKDKFGDDKIKVKWGVVAYWS